MSKNIVMNFCVDEDSNVSIEVVKNLSNWKWLGYMLGVNGDGGGNDLDVDGDEWIELLNGKFNECIENESDEEYLKLVNKKWLVFIEKLKKLMNENVRVIYYVWSVEYDWNIGVMVLE